MSEGAVKPTNPVVAEAHEVDTYHGKLLRSPGCREKDVLTEVFTVPKAFFE